MSASGAEAACQLSSDTSGAENTRLTRVWVGLDEEADDSEISGLFKADLALKKRTETHLLGLTSRREYLTSRYDSELASNWSQQNALIATVKEVSERVYAVVHAAITKQFAKGEFAALMPELDARFRQCSVN